MNYRALLTPILLCALVLALTGCEVFNGGLGNEGSKIAAPIIEHANEVCGKDRDGVRGGTENIMLMEARADDGILTCHDGTNHYFDE